VSSAALPLRRIARWRPASVLPGFGLSFGIATTALSLIVLFPLAMLVLKASSLGLRGLWAAASEPRVAYALENTFGISLAAAATDVLFGVLIAFVLTRFRFPGRGVLDAVVDLPLALPTAVAGISLAALYAPNGWLGAPLATIGVTVAYTRLGIFVALVFVGLPFVVRNVEPLLAELDRELEEASATLGATSGQTLRRVLLPPLAPAILTGFAMAFARGVGEYGSVIFIAGNLAYISEIAPLLVVVKLEQYDYVGATAIATIMLAISFGVLVAINALQAFSRRRLGLG